MTRRRRTRSGFTLIEVLATLVLIGVVLPVAMQGISIALSAGGHARRSVEVAELAEAKLAELVSTGEWQLGQLSGDFSPDLPDARWNCEVVSRDVYMTELNLVVTWPSGRGPREMLLSTLVYLSPDQQ